MGKLCKIVILGSSGVGKTSIIQKSIYGEFSNKEIGPTIEDAYLAQVETDRGVREHFRIYDIGCSNYKTPNEIPKHYYHFGDAFILVYSVNKLDSFKFIEGLKKEIERARDKKDITIIVIGNKTDIKEEREVEFSQAQSWATKEKARLFECSIKNQRSISDPIIWLCSRITQPPAKSTFIGSRKLKQQQQLSQE